MPALLSASAIRKSFAGVHALEGVSFDLAPGEVHALVGENGAGKSTLIRILTGAETADAGDLAIDGRRVDLAAMSPSMARAMGIAVVYQQPALFPDLSIAENVALGTRRSAPWQRIDWTARRSHAAALLERTGARLDPDRLVGSLSMPEQQLVEIARAMAVDARIVLMDEPTASLSEREVARLFEVIAGLRARGVAVVYISHRLGEVFSIADRVTILRDGRTVATARRDELDQATVVRHMAGRDLASVFPKRDVRAGEIAIEVRGLGCATAGIGGISFSVRRGEILGIAGLVGAGRTELAEVLFGLRQADAGHIVIDGRTVVIASPADAVRHGIAYVPEDRQRHGVVADMSISANTSIAALDTVSARGLIDARKERALAERFVRDLQIKAASVDAGVGTLSGGNQQKVALARWLATTPSILILDEPTQGVDVGAKAEIHAVMQAMVERGMAVIMISSELPEILGMSDRIVVMRDGRMGGELRRADATADAVLALALGRTQESGATAGVS